MAAFAGLTLDALVSALASLSRRPWFAYALTGVTIAAIAPTVFILNGRQFFIYSAEHWPTTEETVILREVMSDTCDSSPWRTVVYSNNVDAVVDHLFEYFGWKDKRPLGLSYSDMPLTYGAHGGWGDWAASLSGLHRNQAGWPWAGRFRGRARW